MDIDTLINICIIYSVKELYIIPTQYSKIVYIALLSPLVICNGFYNTGVITNKYWKFLRSMCYPTSPQVTYNGECNIYHRNECSNSLLQRDYSITFKKITSMYFKYYLIHGIYLGVFKKYPLRIILTKELENWLRSSSFLFFQNVFQRLAMCKINNIHPLKLYSITTLCSSFILFEHISRVKQINTMMISNVSISLFNNYCKPYKNQLTFILLMLTFSKNKYRPYLKLPTLLLAIINALHEYNSPKNSVKLPVVVTEEIPIASLPPWHPFL
jgi:hypothetical protein